MNVAAPEAALAYASTELVFLRLLSPVLDAVNDGLAFSIRKTFQLEVLTTLPTISSGASESGGA